MKKLVGLIGIIWGIASCTMSSDSNTFSSVDKAVDFHNYKTFAWLQKDSSKIQNVLYDNDIIAKTIEESTNKELQERGYTIEKYQPDILIQYTLVVEQKEEEIVNTQVIQNIPTRSAYIPTSTITAYDSPANLYYYSNPTNFYNPSYYQNTYPYYNSNNYGYLNNNNLQQLSNNVQQIQYKEGTLIIDMIDRKTGELVWRGWNTDALPNPLVYEQNLPNEIREIFRKYPTLKK